MDIEDIRTIAKRYQINCNCLFKNKIIRKIQMHNGQGNCFSTNHGDSCGYIGCNWREECSAASRIWLIRQTGEHEVLRQLIEESIRLELNVAEVYLGFHHRFHEDADFWWQLVIEEKRHAALLRNGMQHFLDTRIFPGELACASLESLVNVNHELERILKQEKEAPMPREAAFNLAIKLEQSAGEIHFQHAMQETESPSEAIHLFSGLNGDDRDHTDKIRNYMRREGIEEANNQPLSC